MNIVFQIVWHLNVQLFTEPCDIYEKYSELFLQISLMKENNFDETFAFFYIYYTIIFYLIALQWMMKGRTICFILLKCAVTSFTYLIIEHEMLVNSYSSRSICFYVNLINIL